MSSVEQIVCQNVGCDGEGQGKALKNWRNFVCLTKYVGSGEFLRGV